MTFFFFFSEEILYTNKALWVSPLGTKVAILNLNDTAVEEIMVGLGNGNSTNKFSIKYPKVCKYELMTVGELLGIGIPHFQQVARQQGQK